MAFFIRQLLPEDFRTVEEWIVKEKWFINFNMLISQYNQHPQGSIAAETKDGEFIGFIVVPKVYNKMVMGSWFVVRSDWRGKGVGSAILNKAMNIANENQCNFGLTALIIKMPFYFKRGFKYLSFNSTAYSGTIDKAKLSQHVIDGITVEKMQEEQINGISSYDSEILAAPRKGFLKVWTDPTIATTFVALNDEGIITGYGCIQPVAGEQFYIGPLYCDSDDIAELIMLKLISAFPEGKVVGFDTNPENTFLTKFALEHDMQMRYTGQRMYSKTTVQINMKKVYATVSSTIV